jgi:hypothetical protein
MTCLSHLKSAIRVAVVAIILITTSAIAGGSEEWRKDKPCGRQLPEMQPVTLEGCLQAYCGDLPTGARLCACRKSEDTGETQISLETKDGPKKQWIIKIDPPFSAGSFRLDSADLNGDGREEVLFAAMNSMSLGMYVQRWTLRAFDGNEVSNEIQRMGRC